MARNDPDTTGRSPDVARETKCGERGSLQLGGRSKPVAQPLDVNRLPISLVAAEPGCKRRILFKGPIALVAATNDRANPGFETEP